MDRQTQDHIAKFICIAVGCVVAFYVLIGLLPYIEMFLALCGAWYCIRNAIGTIDATGINHVNHSTTQPKDSTTMENNNNNNGNNGLLSILTREGVLLKVSVHYWRGCKKLRPEDIGLEKKDLSDQLISLGHKRLLPKDALAILAVIKGRAHALVEANTFPFLNGLGHFLPNSKLAEVTEKLEELETEFWEAKKAFLEKYASLRQSASKDWRKMAEKLVKDPERLVATIEASFPYPDQMERYYGFDIQRFQIALPQHMAAELVNASEQQAIIEARQKAAQEAGQKIRSDVESFVADCVASLREQTAQLCEDMCSHQWL